MESWKDQPEGFNDRFEQAATEFLVRENLLNSSSDLKSTRFLSRSVAPHARKLSDHFNAQKGSEPYWSRSSNPKNLRTAYFLYQMPAQILRTSAVFRELKQMGYRWPNRPRILDLGSGPGSVACGLQLTNPDVRFQFQLVERDRFWTRLAPRWIEKFSQTFDINVPSLRSTHGFIENLPRFQDSFDAVILCYTFNELDEATRGSLHQKLSSLLKPNGLLILIDPALKASSRQLLEFRKRLITGEGGYAKLKTLLPCRGDQVCGALEDSEDWCHEEISWKRSQWVERIDQLCGLDKRSLPYSYLVMTPSRKPASDTLPRIVQPTSRLVSPSFRLGKSRGKWGCYICDLKGKRKIHYESKKPYQRGELVSFPQ